MMFNYDIESNAFAIFRGMVREIVPARHVDLKSLIDLDKRYKQSSGFVFCIFIISSILACLKMSNDALLIKIS